MRYSSKFRKVKLAGTLKIGVPPHLHQSLFQKSPVKPEKPYGTFVFLGIAFQRNLSNSVDSYHFLGGLPKNRDFRCYT